MRYTIRAFQGFGSTQMVAVSGQVSSGAPSEDIAKDRDQNRRLRRRLWDAVKLATTPRVPESKVRVTCAGSNCDVVADRHGHFSAVIPIDSHSDLDARIPYRVKLLAPQSEDIVEVEGDVTIAAHNVRHIVVTDIDDTIVFTGVANKLMMLWRLFARGADQKKLFPGVGPFYRGLQRRQYDGLGDNPIIYLSRSPWSLYPMLEELFLQHELPEKPVLLLREWGISWRHPYPTRARSHKADMLDRIVKVYPDTPLLLIGDSGQRDPELYRDFAMQNPRRVSAIYLRAVDDSRGRDRELQAMQAELKQQGVDMVVARETRELAIDAAERSFISEATLKEVLES